MTFKLVPRDIFGHERHTWTAALRLTWTKWGIKTFIVSPVPALVPVRRGAQLERGCETYA